MSATLVDLLRRRASETPDRLAFTWLANTADGKDASLTYAELDRQARGVAAWLQQLGPAGERALVVVPPGLDFIAALFGCFYAGWLAVPANPPRRNGRGAARVESIVRDASPRVSITEPTVGECEAWRPPALSGDSLAMLQYTSGSTATPRGVMLTHANLLHNTTQIARRFEATSDSRGLIWLPPYHDMGLIGGILEGLVAGFPIWLMAPLDFLQHPLRWLEGISRTRATISGGPNFAYDLCVDRILTAQREGLDLSSWTVAFNGAEPVRARSLQRFTETYGPYGFHHNAFYPCYGLAEATLMVSGGRVHSPPRVLQLENDRQLVGCGSSIDDQEIVLVDAGTLRRSPTGAAGEVWVRGPSVATGYWSNAPLSREVFNAYLANGDGPFLRTGDQGLFHDDELFISGRLKALLIVNGAKFHAEDLEATLLDVSDTAVALSIDVDGRERLVILAEVDRHVSAADRPADPGAIVSSIRLRIADVYQLPIAAIYLLRRGTLPRTTSGKIQRDACQTALTAGQLPSFHQWQESWD